MQAPPMKNMEMFRWYGPTLTRSTTLLPYPPSVNASITYCRKMKFFAGGLMTGRSSKKRIRYAVVGLGHIAQVAVLPAFVNTYNSELFALVSSDQEKLKALGEKYRIAHLYSYDDYSRRLQTSMRFTWPCRTICIGNMLSERVPPVCTFSAKSRWQ